jgi:hypothetical protein
LLAVQDLYFEPHRGQVALSGLSEELARKKISEAVRTELAKIGLTERALTDDPKPDLIVNHRMSSGNRKKVETWIGPWGGAHWAVYHFNEGRNRRSYRPIFRRMSRSCSKDMHPKRSRLARPGPGFKLD